MYRLHAAPDFASTIPHLALVHLGVPFEVVNVDIDSGGLATPAYRAINPLGLIPAMETPEGPVFETGAILLYLDERHPGVLAPRPGAAGRAAFLSWFLFTANTLHPLTMLLVHPDRAANGVAEAEVSRHIRAELSDRLAHLERALAADAGLEVPALMFYVAVMFRWAQMFAAIPGDVIDPAPFPGLRAALAQVEALPACQTVAEAEWLGPAPFSNPKG
jgi:glutathione S-transferase